MPIIQKVNIPTGYSIIKIAQKETDIYLLLSGKIFVNYEKTIHPEGMLLEEVASEEITPGGYVGNLKEFIGTKYRQNSSVAMEDCTLLILAKEPMRELMIV